MSNSLPEVIISALKHQECIAFDFETTGLEWWKNSAFALALATRFSGDTQPTSYYIDLRQLDRPDLFLKDLFGMSKIWIAHNAKFDMHFATNFGVDINGTIWDTLTLEKLVNNSYPSYSLDSCGQRIGLVKDDSVNKYLLSQKLYTIDEDGEKHFHFDRVPTYIVEPYARKDAEIALLLAESQMKIFRQYDQSHCQIVDVVNVELDIIKVLHSMERRGIKINRDYCDKALKHERSIIKKYKSELDQECGKPFVDSSQFLKPFFHKYQLRHGTTEKGNPSFDAESLEMNVGHPFVDKILMLRESSKRATTYFENFLRIADGNDIIHPDIKSCGAATGRMSCTNPNVQNWPAHDEMSAYPIRRAFILPDPEYKIFSLDYAQMELRLGADEANDIRLISDIKSGTDLHQVVANLAKTSRDTAKNVRFARMYGAGVPKIARMLGISTKEVETIISGIDYTAPGIAKYSANLREYIKVAPFGYNWLGRRYYFKDKKLAYKYPNYRIQGGCADILKIAMIDIHRKLENKKSYMMLPIHDELVLSIHKDEHDLIQVIKDLMINAFISKRTLDLDVSVSYGDNFFDLKDYAT